MTTSSHKTIQHPQSAESGQAIVIIALFMLALVGMVGLAVDGGRMFLAYRQAQAAVDAIALSAAYDRCAGNPDPIPNAVAKMDWEYGYSDDNPEHQVDIDQGPTWTEDTAPHGDQSYIGVRIRDTLEPFFIHLIYQGDLTVTAVSVTQCSLGNNADTSDNGGYAFRSLSDKDDCSIGSPSMKIEGSQFDIYGDIWVGSINGNPDFHTNVNKDPSKTDSPIDIFGDIKVQAEENEAPNSDVSAVGGLESLVEDLPREPYNIGGDGEIEFGAAAPSNGALPYTMDYFRPEDSTLCNSAAECGALESKHPANYYDISAWCVSEDKITKADFLQGGIHGGAGRIEQYDIATNSFDPGIYYASCRIDLADPVYPNGNVTFVSEEKIDYSMKSVQQDGYAGNPVAVSNYGDKTECASNDYAIQLNLNDGTVINGDIVAFEGSLTIQGNAWRMNSCVSAYGIWFNGNSNAEYWCTASEGDDGLPSIRVNE